MNSLQLEILQAIADRTDKAARLAEQYEHVPVHWARSGDWLRRQRI